MIPIRLRATLRPYQEAGVRWLTGLAGDASDAGGGILADDMGLGKALATDALVMTPAGGVASDP